MVPRRRLRHEMATLRVEIERHGKHIFVAVHVSGVLTLFLTLDEAEDLGIMLKNALEAHKILYEHEGKGPV